MNYFRSLIALVAACSVIVSPAMHALGFSANQSLVPVAAVGSVYGLIQTAELLFAAAVSVKLKAHLREQHLLREQIRSQRLKKARR